MLRDGTIDDAYAVQQLNVANSLAEGARLVGWKIGLTSLAVQRQLGVDQPDFGVLLADRAVSEGEAVPRSSLIKPRAEAEIAFVLGRDLPDRPITTIDVMRATEFVLPAIEIVDSRIVDWDITILDTIADNASSGLFVVGGSPTTLDQVDLRDVTMVMTRDGTEVSTGSGAACLGHPLRAVAWLANALAGFGERLREGQVVLSGALGPVVPVEPRTAFEAHLSGLGSVRVTFDD